MKSDRNNISTITPFLMRGGFVMLCTLLFAGNTFSDVLSVPAGFTTIQQAINTASPGDTILVDPGTYTENIDFLGKSITLKSTAGAEATIIEPAAAGTVVKIGPGGEISGLMIRNGYASSGAGMIVTGTGARITQNIFDSNGTEAGGYGAAIAGNAASALINRNIFRYNTCDNQYISGVVAFVNQSSPRIENNIFVDNPCRAINLTLPSGGVPLVVNNTIVRNLAGIRIDRRIPLSQQIYRNNIIVDNEIGLEVDFGTEDNNPVWEHNLVYGNRLNYELILDQSGVSGNISADPMFKDPLTNDFRLQGGSPAVDSGTSAGAPDTDFEGDLRPVDGDGDMVAQFDIGSDEFSAGASINIAGGNIQECATFGGTQVSMEANLVLPPGTELFRIEWYLDDVLFYFGTTAEALVSLGQHTVEARAVTVDSGIIQSFSSIDIVDTTAPVVNIGFTDSETGAVITSIPKNSTSTVEADISTSDACDNSPLVTAVTGIPTIDGDIFRIRPRKGNVTINGTEIQLSVTATDASGNATSGSASLAITQ